MEFSIKLQMFANNSDRFSGVVDLWSADVFLMSTLRGLRFNYLLSSGQNGKGINPCCVPVLSLSLSLFLYQTPKLKRNPDKIFSIFSQDKTAARSNLAPHTISCLSLIWEQAGVNDTKLNLLIEIKTEQFWD